MKAWHEVIVPHRDIREGGFDESVFAADLSDVIAGRGPLEYRDAALFFRQTYPTQGLRQLLQAVLHRLSGEGSGEAVIQIQTPFGGGKTHSLIALYHLCKHGAGIQQEVADLLGQIGMTAPPSARVATFVGTAADPLRGKTPWGELAEQLGVYSLLREHDEKRRAPGKDLLHQMFGDQPTLVLMDEVAEYVVKAHDFAGQVLAFFQELTEAVKVLPRCVLVVTLPSSAPYGEEGERTLQQLQQIFGRVESVYTPVEGEEIYEVIRHRLFEPLSDPREASRTAEAFWEMYQRLGEDVPAEARDPAYRQRMERAYPFHPELIDLLLERWSTFPTFQRTRGVLRLLAEVVADSYRQNLSSPLILPAHVRLENATIRRELLKHIGPEYEGVISSDIAGAGAKAPQIDREMGSEYTRFHVASGLATAIFFGSFSGGERRGMGIQRLRLSVLREGLLPALVSDALRRLEDSLWYLHEEGGVYSFSVKPNLNHVMLTKEEGIRDADIDQEVRRLLERWSGRELRVTLFPDTSADVPDTRELKLCILRPQQSRQSPGTEPLVQELLSKSGLTFRVYLNTLLAVVADSHEWNTLREQVKRWLALRAVQQDSGVMQRLAQEDKNRLQAKIRDYEADIPFHLLCTYRHLAKWQGSAVHWEDMGLPTTGERGSLAKRVVDFLKSEESLLERIAPHILLRYTLRDDQSELAVRDIVDTFYRYPHLPMLQSEQVVFSAIAQGVRDGVFGVRVGDRHYFKQEVSFSLLQDEAVLVREPKVMHPPAPPVVSAISVEEILQAMGMDEQLTLAELRQRVHQQRAQHFPDEQEFERAFEQAVRAALESERVLAEPAVVRESATSLSPHLVLRKPLMPPSATATAPSPRRTYHLRARVPLERFSEFLRGVPMHLKMKGAEVQMEVSLTARAGSEPIPESTIEQVVRETLRQIGADVLEERLD